MQFSKSQNAYFLMNAILIVGICTCVITGKRVVEFGGFIFPASNIIFSFLTFPITDVISELWGRKAASKTVYVSFVCQTLFAVIMSSSVYLPYPETYKLSSQYDMILGSSMRVLIASMVAYLTAQMWDVIVYHKIKDLTKGKYIWLRNNISTFTSQLLNSTVFIIIAFYGSGLDIKSMIFGSVLLKWIIACIDTPIVYGMIIYLRKYLGDELEEETYEDEPKLAEAMS